MSKVAAKQQLNTEGAALRMAFSELLKLFLSIAFDNKDVNK